MGESKKKAVARNAVVTTAYEAVVVILGFIIPRLFLTTYGPTIHGVTSAISNIMSYVLLINAGLSTASIQSLYTPLAKRDEKRLNQVLNAIRDYYFLTGIAFTAVVIILALILPWFIEGISALTLGSLMVVMGLQSILDSFLVSKYETLLEADQKLYIMGIFNLIALLFRGAIQVFLIYNRYSVVLVQAVPALAILIIFVMQRYYVKRKYSFLDYKVKGDKRALNKRWSAFLHQIAGVVVNNVDVVLLTVTGKIVLVSIYSVYQLVFTNLYNLMRAIFSHGITASLGHLMASEEERSLRENFSIYELVYFSAAGVVYGVVAVTILPFVALYTSGVKGVNYVDGKLAVLFIVIAMANNMRVPGNTLINAGGYYKETQWRAVAEALINIIASLILFSFLGIYGILLGTVLSFAYRTTDIILYSNKKILKGSSKRTWLRVIKTAGVVTVTAMTLWIINFSINNWIEWILLAVGTASYSLIITALIAFITEKKELKRFIRIIKEVLPERK